MESSSSTLKKVNKSNASPSTFDLAGPVDIAKSILIRNFSSHVSEKQLLSVFGLFGEVAVLTVLRRFGKPSCRAIATYSRESEAQAAVNVLESNPNGKSLKVTTLWCDKNFIIDGIEGEQLGFEENSNRVLSVENLPSNTHHDRLQALFAIFGSIEKISMNSENKSATISYSTPHSPEAAAVCMDGFLEGKKVVVVCVIIGYANDSSPVKFKVSDDVGVGISPWELRQLFGKLKAEARQPLKYVQPSMDEPCCSKSPSDAGRSTSASENEESEVTRHVADLKISAPVAIHWTRLMASKNLTISFIVDLNYCEDHSCCATYEGDVKREILPCSNTFRVPLAENTIVVRSGLIYLQVIIRLFPEHQKEYFDSPNPIKYSMEKPAEDLYIPMLLHLSVSCNYSESLLNLSTFSRASVDVTNLGGMEPITLEGKGGKRSFSPVPYDVQTILASVPLEDSFMDSVKESFNKWTASERYDPFIPGIGQIQLNVPCRLGHYSFLFPTHAIIENYKMENFNEYRTGGF